MTKKTTLLLLLAGSVGWLTLTSYSSGPGTTGAGDLSATGCGSPATGCHANNSTATMVQSVTLVPSDGGPATPAGQYTPGRTYAVSILGSLNPASTSLTHFGFQTTARRADGATVGTINLAGTTSLQTYTLPATGRTGVEHSAKILKNSAGFFTKTWQWTAPSVGTGDVTFFTAINAVNNNGNTSGDQGNVGTTVFTEGTAASVTDVSQATQLAIHPNPAKDLIHLDAQSWKAGAYNIAILNTAGSVVLRQTVDHYSTAESIDVVLPNLATGLYGIRVQGEGFAQSAPLFIR